MSAKDEFIRQIARLDNPPIVADLLHALKTIAQQCGPFAAEQPALDYAGIGNIGREAIVRAGGAG